MKHRAISWNTRDRNLIRKVCRYLGVSPYLSVNRITRIGLPTEEQLEALKPLEMNGSIRVLTFSE